MNGNFLTPCTHLSTYYRKLKLFPTNTVLVMSYNLNEIYLCVGVELIGKNLEQIISNMKISDDINHFNRLRCEQVAFDSNSNILVCWKFQDRLFVFELWIRNVHNYDSNSMFNVEYEVYKMWEIIGKTKVILGITGIIK